MNAKYILVDIVPTYMHLYKCMQVGTIHICVLKHVYLAVYPYIPIYILYMGPRSVQNVPILGKLRALYLDGTAIA